MEKIIEGVKRFHASRDVDFYKQLASGQSPRALFITCCDSRIVPHVFTSSEPGDLFMLRVVGNIVPVYQKPEGAVYTAIDYALRVLRVPQIIVCGHADCGAFQGDNAVSKENVVTQLANLETYPIVSERLKQNDLSIHGLWFDIGEAQVYRYDGANFVLIV